jgi:predicted nucleic acid-binding protein
VPADSVAVADAGPIIHLGQVDRLGVLQVFRSILVTSEVLHEIGNRSSLPKNAKIVESSPTIRDLAAVLSAEHGLGLGESSAIALCRHQSIRLLLTDDLEAREVGSAYGLEPHGTLGLVARAHRQGLLDKREAIGVIDDLRSRSSLYLTGDLAQWARRQIESFRE